MYVGWFDQRARESNQQIRERQMYSPILRGEEGGEAGTQRRHRDCGSCTEHIIHSSYLVYVYWNY
jgi:hypothetical protein